MLLHWLIAIAILAMIPLGIWMSDAIGDPAQQATAYRVFQLHKAVGFTILALTLVRLAWRLLKPPPPPAANLQPWEVFLSRATHAAFYAILILVPLSGWVYVSTGWAVSGDAPFQVATSWFGLLEIPHLQFVAGAALELRRQIAFEAMGFHWTMVLCAIVLIVLHAVAALKHHFIDRDSTLAAMVPGLRVPGKSGTRRKAGGAKTAAVLGIALVVLISGLSAVTGLFHDWRPGEEAALAAAAAENEEGAPASPIDLTVEPGTAPEWQVADGAELGFSGMHADEPFTGGFEDWSAHIWFDPDDLAGSKITILIETGSAVTGDRSQEGSLRQDEWFGIETYPIARFDSAAIEPLGGDAYQVSGTLQMKERQVPVSFEADIAIDGDTASATGGFDLEREALNLGMQSDPDAAWVSAVIPVTFTLDATRR